MFHKMIGDVRVKRIKNWAVKKHIFLTKAQE